MVGRIKHLSGGDLWLLEILALPILVLKLFTACNSEVYHSDKVLLVACRHYITATGVTSSDFVRELLDLAGQAQDEFADNLSSLLEDLSKVPIAA